MSNKDIKKILADDGIIIFPTDTVYGMGVLPKKEAIKKIYDIKERDENKKIIALVSSKEIAKSLFEYNSLTYKLIDEFFPGEITIISKGKKEFLDILGYIEDIGIRMPNSNSALELIASVGGIIMTTSVNKSGKSPALVIDDIEKEILDKVDVVIESKEKMTNKPSSIFKIENDNIVLIREGDISLSELLKFKEEIN